MSNPSQPVGYALARRSPALRNGTVDMSATVLYVSGFDGRPMELELALRNYFLARRPAAIDRLNRRYPETLVYEIRQAATALYNESRRYVDRHWWGDDDDYAGQADAVKRYGDFYKRLSTELDALPPGATYPGNANAWQEMRRIGIKLAVAADSPPPERSVVASVIHGVRELPNTLSTVAAKVSEAAIAPVKANLIDAAKFVAIPVAIAGAAFVGGVLLLRQPRPRERAS